MFRGRKKPVKNITDSLKIEPLDKLRHLTFNFLEFRYFWDSENGKAIFLGNPRLLKPLIIVPYMLTLEVYNFRTKRYFIKFKNKIIAQFGLRLRHDTLIVSSLAVSPECRRHSIGLFILNWTENLARHTKTEWLELAVLKRNTPAQRLYQKFGFKITAEKILTNTEKENSNLKFTKKEKVRVQATRYSSSLEQR